jgi:hypothetical protein
MEIDMDERDRQLFILPSEIWDAVTRDDVQSTSNDMLELGIYNPPIRFFDVYATASPRKMATWLLKNINYEFRVDRGDIPITYRFRYDFDEDMANYTWYWGMIDGNKINYFDFDDPRFVETLKIEAEAIGFSFDQYSQDMLNQLRILQSALLTTLITTLAAKNVIKDTQEVKRHGPKSKKRPRTHRYITTIKIGKITETNRQSDGSGSTVRPHLRRGHIRNQHFGEGNKEIKKIFIQPVFVNADEGWIENQRKAYVVKAA